MPRKKKGTTPADELTAETTAAGAAPIDRKPEVAASAAEPQPPADAPSEPAPDEGGEPRRQWAVGPQWFKSVSLGDERGAPKMDLGRDHKFKQLAIRFPDRPENQVLDALHADGWTWRGKEKYWTKQLDADRPAASQQNAETFFEELATEMRARRGLADSPAVA